jgi:predicted alpha/beta-hydrolase family hydrolase
LTFAFLGSHLTSRFLCEKDFQQILHPSVEAEAGAGGTLLRNPKSPRPGWVRGQADDHLLDLATPTLFLVGQNAARSSEEEIELFREKLSAPTTTCVVGAADDFLRVNKTKRRLEGVTQEMVYNMIVDPDKKPI